MKSIKDILVVSDLDNTLLTAEKGIPEYNLEMIKKFQELGGNFTVATGRTIESVSRYLDQMELSTPAITYNGGIIYDYKNRIFLLKETLPENAKRALDIIREKFPDVGCEIMCDNNRLYMIRENAYTFKHVDDEKLSYVCSDLENVKNNWIKVLFADRNSRLLELQEFCRTLPFDDIEFVMSNTIYFEMLPKGTTKGTALRKLCDMLNIDIADTVAVGDYYNDIELLKTAGLSVCVDNAPQEIKNICHAVVPKCTDGGVGHLLAQIIKSGTT
ncbi:MAG: HAD family hydrolase [Oscillospiraceae bacterium]|nr:HAD family hydrolase [Oscillospiraceae bacterium]